MKLILAAALLGATAILFGAIAIMPLWQEPPHDADTEVWASRFFGSLALLAAFAAGLLL